MSYTAYESFATIPQPSRVTVIYKATQQGDTTTWEVEIVPMPLWATAEPLTIHTPQEWASRLRPRSQRVNWQAEGF